MKFIDVLNRVVIVILCLVLLVALAAVFLYPQSVLTQAGQWMMDWGNYLGQQDPRSRLVIGILLTIVVAAILILIIFFEVRRGRRRFIRVQQVAGGMATVSTDSVKQMLRHKLDPMAGVIEVDPRVEAKGNKVHVRVEVGVARGTNVPQVANQIIKATQEVLTDELGLQIAGQPEVRVTVVHDKGVEVETAPPPPPTTYRPEPVVEEESAEAPPPLPYDTPEAEEEEADEGQETDVA